jgi:hypothetical protein
MPSKITKQASANVQVERTFGAAGKAEFCNVANDAEYMLRKHLLKASLPPGDFDDAEP